ncbi:MAG: TetR/AcrR family transcriptional regulator, partial [Solirubrobacterales bacterium]
VYNHFPTDVELIEACSIHWITLNPLPDSGAWAAIEDPKQRLAAALGELYEWYGKTEDMMGKVIRDAPIVPALGEVMSESWFAAVDQMVEALLAGRGVRGTRRQRLRATLRLAVDFNSWKTLKAEGLDDPAAAELAAGFVAASE